MDSISRPHFLDTNYAAVDPTDFLPKNGDFPQVSAEFLMSLGGNQALECWGLLFSVALLKENEEMGEKFVQPQRGIVCSWDQSSDTRNLKSVHGLVGAALW